MAHGRGEGVCECDHKDGGSGTGIGENLQAWWIKRTSIAASILSALWNHIDLVLQRCKMCAEASSEVMQIASVIFASLEYAAIRHCVECRFNECLVPRS